MKSFKDYINENEWKVAEDFLASVEAKFKKEFPNGFFLGRAEKGLSGPLIVFRFGLIKETSDCSNGIRENDPMFHTVMIHSNGDFEGTNLEFNPLQGGLYIKPEEGSYLAMQSVKTKMRKAKGTLAKFEKAMGTFFPKLKTLVKANKDNIHNIENIDKKYLKGL